MSHRDFPCRAHFGAVIGMFAAITFFFNAAAVAPDSIKLAPGVIKAAEGYETSFYDTKVTGELKRGDHVDVLAKVKGWEWVLVGKGGTSWCLVFGIASST